ncbi:MAG TPA: transglycosylase SLT domain-containing protein [Candidatus Wallbacteria bacterium]|nr:transglycosylase SLT domain-containing protein [Candidatus Wallbacteria bacterium]
MKVCRNFKALIITLSLFICLCTLDLFSIHYKALAEEKAADSKKETIKNDKKKVKKAQNSSADKSRDKKKKETASNKKQSKDKKDLKPAETSPKKKTETSGKSPNKSIDDKKSKDDKTSASVKSKNQRESTDEVVINSTRFKLGGLTLEENSEVKSGEKLKKIKELASEIKQSYEKTQKTRPKKTNRYSLKLPQSYNQVDMKLARQVMERVNLKSLSMFRTLYQPYVKTGKLKKISEPKNKSKDELDGRIKMTVFIVGNFINEVIEKYDSGNLSKTHKNFGDWITDGANILAYGGAYSMKLPTGKSSKKKKEKGGVISVSVAKKLLRALIETESSGTQMRGGKVLTSLNMATYPNDGSYVIGFMQESVNDFARGVNLFDPEVNIKYTCKKLHKYLVKYGGNIDKMLREYNAGAGNMDCAQAHRYSGKIMSRMNNY